MPIENEDITKKEAMVGSEVLWGLVCIGGGLLMVFPLFNENSPNMPIFGSFTIFSGYYLPI